MSRRRWQPTRVLTHGEAWDTLRTGWWGRLTMYASSSVCMCTQCRRPVLKVRRWLRTKGLGIGKCLKAAKLRGAE